MPLQRVMQLSGGHIRQARIDLCKGDGAFTQNNGKLAFYVQNPVL